jgi:hypothetical protein
MHPLAAPDAAVAVVRGDHKGRLTFSKSFHHFRYLLVRKEYRPTSDIAYSMPSGSRAHK